MEEKKFNNAIEKAENLSEDTQKVKSTGAKNTKKTTASKSGAKKSTSSVKGGYNKASTKKEVPLKQAKREALLAEKQEKEEERARKRIEAQEKKEQKKQDKKRAMLAKKQARERKRESVKQMRIKKREERLARRDALKHESKEQRRERIHERKQKLAELRAKKREQAVQERREKREQHARIRQEKINARREKRAQRADERREKRERRTSRGLGGWLAAVIVLGCSTLVLTTLLVFNNYMSGGGSNMLSGSYSKAFYDLVGYVDNIDVNLSKIAVTRDEQSNQRMITDLMVQSNLAAEDLEALPLKDESKFSTIKFINQLGDFSKYLNNKLISGEQLSEEDVNNIQEFKRINGILKQELNELCGKMGNDFDFCTMLSGESENIVFESFNKLEANAVDYPKMIYDGPFADDPQELEPIKRVGEKINEDKAISLVQSVFEGYEITDLQISGEVEGKTFNCYNVLGELTGEQFFAQVSEFGELITFDYYKQCEGENYSRDQAIDFGYEFLNKCGYKSVKAVWVTQDNGTCYINFAGVQDQIILYSDLIKVSVCLNSGRVYAMDAKSYVENHKQREIPDPQIRVEQAELKLSDKMQVMTSRLAYIPLETGKEKLAYEFFCETADGEEFYVYIDALTGKQLEIFKVVLTDQGTLLL